MKPSKKAKDLFFKLKNIDSDSEMFDNFKMKDFYAQRCLLILVNEFIYETSFEVLNVRQKYWQEVKEEIEKL
jgi:hypothetical protein